MRNSISSSWEKPGCRERLSTLSWVPVLPCPFQVSANASPTLGLQGTAGCSHGLPHAHLLHTLPRARCLFNTTRISSSHYSHVDSKPHSEKENHGRGPASKHGDGAAGEAGREVLGCWWPQRGLCLKHQELRLGWSPRVACVSCVHESVRMSAHASVWGAVFPVCACLSVWVHLSVPVFLSVCL